jgi:hypothetical protein
MSFSDPKKIPFSYWISSKVYHLTLKRLNSGPPWCSHWFLACILWSFKKRLIIPLSVHHTQSHHCYYSLYYSLRKPPALNRLSCACLQPSDCYKQLETFKALKVIYRLDHTKLSSQAFLYSNFNISFSFH